MKAAPPHEPDAGDRARGHDRERDRHRPGRAHPVRQRIGGQDPRVPQRARARPVAARSGEEQRPA